MPLYVCGMSGGRGLQIESKKALQQLNEEKDALVAQLARRVEDLQALTKSRLIHTNGSTFMLQTNTCSF
jgi:hypothetical protein